MPNCAVSEITIVDESSQWMACKKPRQTKFQDVISTRALAAQKDQRSWEEECQHLTTSQSLLQRHLGETDCSKTLCIRLNLHFPVSLAADYGLWFSPSMSGKCAANITAVGGLQGRFGIWEPFLSLLRAELGKVLAGSNAWKRKKLKHQWKYIQGHLIFPDREGHWQPIFNLALKKKKFPLLYLRRPRNVSELKTVIGKKTNLSFLI